MYLTTEEQQQVESLAEKARRYREQQEAALEEKRARKERNKREYINHARKRAEGSALLAWGSRGR